MDRIAAAARSNKAQIYHYFGSKDGLFNAVFDEIVLRTLDEVPIDTEDLAEYAGRLFDGYEAHPEVQRLATWQRLERNAESAPIELVASSMRSKVDAVAKAQRAGAVSKTFAPADLLAIVLHLSGLWSATQPEYAPLFGERSADERRKVVVESVRAVLRA